MSGGHFNYAYSHVEAFSEKLQRELGGDAILEFYDARTLNLLQLIATNAKATALLMKEVEWLMSGDTGPETFTRRVVEIERKAKL